MLKEDVDSLLSSMIESYEGVSDIFFVVGKPPQVEAYGKLKPYPDDSPAAILTPNKVEDMAVYLMNGVERLQRDFLNMGACDCSYGIEGFARFRVNIFRQNGHHAIVMRKLNSVIPTIDKLNLQPIFREMIKEKTGIIFVTGATGSGKTTTLAAMLNELNQQNEIHIVTLEDPIEFMHPHAKATFSQRELGRDFPEFSAGLRSALRQAPKVILVGEIRDRETMEIALTAAETGHVVFSTLHTINAGQTINRILGFFGKDEEQLVRERLVDTLRFVVSQRLIPKIGGGRLMINEIMGSSLRTRETLLLGEAEGRTYSDIIEASSTYGWRTFDMSLVDAYAREIITEETAMVFSTSKSKVRHGIDHAKKIGGREDAEPAVKLKLSA
ncbi:MAG TPA: PilT/PilU family type 4a pilus ATPase [Chthoniobacteraceae bacterium]|jgi:twitching motility protein PilT|nr:PilT/PilU family type 4a pilus ATPase [Chthoniobacteraceae bacterium]